MDPDSPQPAPAPETSESAPVVSEPATNVSESPPEIAPSDSAQPTTDPLPTPDPSANSSQVQEPTPSTDTTPVSIETPVSQSPEQIPPEQSTPVSPQPQPSAETPISPVTQSPIIPGQVTPEMASLFQSWLTAYQKTFRALGTIGLKNKRQKHLDRVVELAGERGSITRQELRLSMRMSAAQIDKYTHELVAAGRLRHVGHYSHGRYERV